MSLKHGDNITVGGIPATVDTRINTSGYDKLFLDSHTFVKVAGLNRGSGWIPNVFINKVDQPESIHNLVCRARTLTDTARQRLRPFVDAISDYLCLPKDQPLGVHWLGEKYSIKCYRGTGAAVSLAYEPIYTWEVEDAIHFHIEIEYFNPEHSGDTESEWYSPLHRQIEIRAPLSLAEDFTKKDFEAWVKSEERRLSAEVLKQAAADFLKAKKLAEA